MIALPITLCLYTSTKGHFDRDTYRETVTDLLRQVPAQNLDALLAHVKWEPGDEVKRDEMSVWLRERGFIVFDGCNRWSHNHPSHNEGYCEDIRKMVSKVRSPYYWHAEDDWLIKTDSLVDQLADAVRRLETSPDLLQVRFPRYTNEPERIRGLRAKHGIDAKVEEDGLGGTRHNDWSNHPYVARTRDVNAAIRFVFATNLPRHTEHGLSVAMKLLSDGQTPFFTPDAAKIRVGHIGVRTPEERDDLSKPLLAT